ncbi:MAG: hypothetical protein R3E86_11965 [Pseudomonadales bacterium]
MNGHEEQLVARAGERGLRYYDPASDNPARVIAYFGPYVFWSVVTVIVSGILLLQ